MTMPQAAGKNEKYPLILSYPGYFPMKIVTMEVFTPMYAFSYWATRKAIAWWWVRRRDPLAFEVTKHLITNSIWWNLHKAPVAVVELQCTMEKFKEPNENISGIYYHSKSLSTPKYLIKVPILFHQQMIFNCKTADFEGTTKTTKLIMAPLLW